MVTDRKKELIDKLINDPIGFTDEEITELIGLENFTNKDLRYISRRIYDLDEGAILNRSEADQGFIGRFNRYSQSRKNKIFYSRIKKGIRGKQHSKIIVAEGDSWFEYPLFIKEITDWLIKNENYALYSLAYGADWLSNMIYEGKYIEKLQLLAPDVFLISGGGNDLVGGRRLAILVDLPSKIEEFEEFNAIRDHHVEYYVDKLTDGKMKKKFKRGSQFLNKEFYGLLKVFKLQYTLLFSGLNNSQSKFPNLKIITQGYDYPIPTFKRGFGFNPFKFVKPLTNYFMDNGIWLKQPLMIKGIVDQEDQEAILFAMIQEFNEMLIETGASFKNVYHIDCRGSVPIFGWYNELHPYSKYFKKIAKAYQKCIDGDVKGRIIKVSELS